MTRNLSVPIRVRMDQDTTEKVKLLSKATRVPESEIYRAAVQQKLSEWSSAGSMSFPIRQAIA